MNLKSNVHKATRCVLSVVFAFAAILGTMTMAGCSGSGGAEVPGAYGVDPKSVHAANATDVAVVIAPCQGQAFRVPEAVFSYVKGAIESEGYVGLTVADQGTVNGRVRRTTKNSQQGKEKEIHKNTLQAFSAVCCARPSEEGVNLMESLNAAARDLQARGTGDEKVLCVVASGVTEGVLETSPALLSLNPEDVAAQLKDSGNLADMDGLKVQFFGLGQSTGDQAIPGSVGKGIEELMSGIVEAAGGEAVVCTDQLVPLGCDDQLPEVAIVEFEADSLAVPEIAPGETGEVVITENVVRFAGDSAEFANEKKAQAVLRGVARDLASKGYSVSVIGHTANTGDGDGAELSLARAQAVAGVLVECGVSSGQIERVAGVGCSESTCLVDGVFNEAQASLDRKVVLHLSRP